MLGMRNYISSDQDWQKRNIVWASVKTVCLDEIRGLPQGAGAGKTSNTLAKILI